MKRWPLGVVLALTALALIADRVLARVAVEHNVAGALLSPAGLDDPLSWLVALGFLGARLGASALVCLSVGLVAASLTARVLRARR